MSAPLRILRHLQQSVTDRGFGPTVGRAFRAVRNRISPPTLPPHPFDVQHGVDTGGLIGPSSLNSGHANEQHSSAYWGTHPSLFAGVISAWQTSLAMPVERYSFVDIGCGKGRVLMMATELPFESVTGIDLNQELVNVANSNLAKWLATPRACTTAIARRDDALTFAVPETPVALYLYHPFGAAVLAPFLERLSALAGTRSSPIDILHANCEHKALVAATPGVRLLWEAEVPFSAEDLAVDAFQAKSHPAAVFRLDGRLASV